MTDTIYNRFLGKKCPKCKFKTEDYKMMSCPKCRCNCGRLLVSEYEKIRYTDTGKLVELLRRADIDVHQMREEG